MQGWCDSVVIARFVSEELNDFKTQFQERKTLTFAACAFRMRIFPPSPPTLRDDCSV